MTNDQLKQRRQELGLSQPQMARELNTPLSTYRKWEQGARRVPGIVVVAIEKIKIK